MTSAHSGFVEKSWSCRCAMHMGGDHCNDLGPFRVCGKVLEL